MIIYDYEDIQTIIKHSRDRGYRYLDAFGKCKESPLHANNKIINWLKNRKALCLQDLIEIAPAEYPPEKRSEFLPYQIYRQEFCDFKNVMFEIDILNMPAYISDGDIIEYVKARLEIGK